MSCAEAREQALRDIRRSPSDACKPWPEQRQETKERGGSALEHRCWRIAARVGLARRYHLLHYRGSAQQRCTDNARAEEAARNRLHPRTRSQRRWETHDSVSIAEDWTSPPLDILGRAQDLFQRYRLLDRIGARIAAQMRQPGQEDLLACTSRARNLSRAIDESAVLPNIQSLCMVAVSDISRDARSRRSERQKAGEVWEVAIRGIAALHQQLASSCANDKVRRRS